MSQSFNWGEVAPSASGSDFEFASGLFRDGIPLAEIHKRLRQRGLTQEIASQVVTALTVDHAGKLFSRGMKAAQVKERLLQQGLSWEEAEAAVDMACEGRAGAVGSHFGIWMLGIGCLLILAGAVLWYGNQSGQFPTFPLAGFLLALFGLMSAGIGGYQFRS